MAVLVAQGLPTTLSLGPFVSATNADTILAALSIPQAECQLSLNGGTFAPTAATTGAVAQGLGYYQIPFSAVDTATLGLLRLSVQHAGALPIWHDALVVPQDVYIRLQGLTSAPLVLQGSTPTLMVGPFVAVSDGATVLSGLTVAQADIQLSKAQGSPVQTQNASGAVAAGLGHYQVALTAGDTDTPGPLRIQIDPASALPVWMETMVVPLAVWQIFFPVAPPVIVVPPGPAPGPTPGPLMAGDLLVRVAAALDDATMIHTDEAGMLLFLSRAQQWVALRYRLLVHTVPLDVLPTVPWYTLPSRWPQLVVATHVTRSTGTPLQPVPLSRLRYSDPQWLATPGTPTRFYRVGWTLLGFYPVPLAYETMHVTGLWAPRRLTELAQRLEVPASYADACVDVAVGLALIGRERAYEAGMQRIARGLGSTAAAQPPQEVAA